MSWAPMYEAGDFAIEPNSGRFVEATGELKLAQDIANAMMTFYDPVRDYGSEMTTLIGQYSTNSKSMLMQMASDAVARLRAKQISNTVIDSTEQIASIKDVRVALDPSTHTKVYSLVKVQTVAGQEQTSISTISPTTPINLDHQYL
jgi:hypothetical protein